MGVYPLTSDSSILLTIALPFSLIIFQFNLETFDIDGLKDELKYWRSQVIAAPQPPPLIIDIFLDISALTQNQTLMLRDELTQRRQRVGNDQLHNLDPNTGIPVRIKSVLLESWQLTLS